HLCEIAHAFGGSCLGVQKTVKRETPGHHPKADLLTALPVHSLMRQVFLAPALGESPETFGIRLVSPSPVSSHQRIRQSESGRLPNYLDVSVRILIDLGPVKIRGDALTCKRIRMPVGGKPGPPLCVLEVENRSVGDFVGYP